MKWRGRKESGNIVDRRGAGKGAMGIGTLLVGAAIYYFLGGNPVDFVAQNVSQTGSGPSSVPSDVSDERKAFAGVVLQETEVVWNKSFQSLGQSYQEPSLVLFRGRVESACGRASSAVGPFYCPGDQQIYLDLGFFDVMEKKLGAGGDFASAYVIAHEVGHHIQNLLGIEKEFRSKSAGASQKDKNALSVIIELQADCLAGVWAGKIQNTTDILENGDIEEATTAASAIGDDTLQSKSQGEVMPDSFTHGSSAQRVAAFNKGLKSSDAKICL